MRVHCQQIYLRIYFNFDAIHFGISLFIISSIYKNLIKDFVKARNKRNLSLDHCLLFFIIQPHKFCYWFNRSWKCKPLSVLAKFSDNSITTKQRHIKQNCVLWQAADISVSTEKNFLCPMSQIKTKKSIFWWCMGLNNLLALVAAYEVVMSQHCRYWLYRHNSKFLISILLPFNPIRISTRLHLGTSWLR